MSSTATIRALRASGVALGRHPQCQQARALSILPTVASTTASESTPAAAQTQADGPTPGGRKRRLSEAVAASGDSHFVQHDDGNARAFSTMATATTHRPSPASDPSPNAALSRGFNTSRTLKAPQDNSPIDLAYLPILPSGPPQQREWISVPFLPDNFAPVRTASTAEVTDTDVLRPEISTAAMHHHDNGGAPPSAMSDVTDNSAMNLDPYELTHTVSEAAVEAAGRIGAQGTEAALRKEQGTLREVWSGFLDDLLGGPAKPRSA
ncbi:MAG: hypothetical protein M1832_003058 [Thelocarpon impressellum]|nr:MAG: hypothetical protein M1832_003058 [Thelocarpon impressellum]